jgi:multidrug efflux pump subunit AcrA (membrane-fusion protein)
MTDIRAAVMVPGFRPQLRDQLKFYRDAATPGVVIVHDTTRDSRLQLYEVECLIAKQMDGTRDLDAVTRAAKPHVPWATREHIEKLAVQIAGMGLLSNVRPPAMVAKGTPARMTAPNVADEELDMAELLDSTTLEPVGSMATVLEPMPEEGLEPEPAPSPKWSSGLAMRMDAVMRPSQPIPVAIPEPATHSTRASQPMPIAAEPAYATRASQQLPIASEAYTTRPSQQIPSASEPAYEPPSFPQLPPEEAFVPEPAPIEEPAPAPEGEPAPASESEAEPWVVEKTPFRKRRWVRRLTYLAVPAVIIMILGVIPYPLYVTEPCTVVPSKRVHVRTPIDGLIAEVYVGEGDFVKAGQPLIRLDDRTISFEQQKAASELQRLKLNLDKTKVGSRPEEVRRAEAKVSTASNDVHFATKKLRRASDLLRNGVGSIQERDEAQRDLSHKKSLFGEAVAELKLVRAGSRSEEVAIAEAEVRRAEAEVKHYQRQLDSLLIKAPISGRVLTPRFRERLHEKLKEGDLVGEIGDVQVMRVEIEVPEREADVLQVGQPVTLKVHSLPLKSFVGSVKFIAPAVEATKDGSRILRVDAEIANTESLLQPGMTGYAEIDADQRTVLGRITRRTVRWIRVRFLL